MHVEDDTVSLTTEEQQQFDDQRAEDDARAKGTTKVDDKSSEPPAAAAKQADEPSSEERTAAALIKSAQALDAAATRLETVATTKTAEPPAAKVEPPKEPDWNAEKEALRAKLSKGEIDDDEYEDEREKLLERKSDWKADALVNQRLQQRDEEQRKQAQQTEQQSWDSAVAKFQGDAENKALVDDPIKAGALNAMLQVVAREQPHLNTAGNHEKLFAAARVRVLEAFGVKAETDVEKKARIAKEEKARKDAAGRPLKNLDSIPNAGVATDRDNKFSDIDSLEINDLENTLAHMSEDKAREYLESAPGGLKDNPRAA